MRTRSERKVLRHVTMLKKEIKNKYGKGDYSIAVKILIKNIDINAVHIFDNIWDIVFDAIFLNNFSSQY